MKLRLDDVDLLILSALQEDAHLSNADIGRHVGMVPSGVFERIRKLEKAKVITGYEARLDANALNFPLAAFFGSTAKRLAVAAICEPAG